MTRRLFNIGLEKVIRELSNTRQEITQTVSELLETIKNGTCVNQEKTKFIVISRKNENRPNLQVDNLTFAKVENS